MALIPALSAGTYTLEIVTQYAGGTPLKTPRTIHAKNPSVSTNEERIAMAKSLFGILPPVIDDKEIRDARLKRYEGNY